MKIEDVDDSSDVKIFERAVEYDSRRQIVAVDAKRALVGAGARILFYPTLLYNVFRNKIQSEFRWWDQVDQFLLLGAVPFPKDVPRLKQLDVGGVITLNEPYETLVPTSLYRAYDIDHLVIPTRDYLFAPSFVDIDRAVNFIHKNASHGRTTYVHCKAGRGRSTTIVLCYLVEYKHMTPASALEYVRSRRPRVLLAPSQWKAVQEYKQWRLAASSSRSASGDAVLITKADLEGYHSPSSQVALIPRSRPMIAKLSCLFASLKVSGITTAPVSLKLTETPAC
ncbi:putative dual specificity protein phosphatase DSP8 [Cynara cardunculus var. scolymus]|uniref:putative dual specificity protein phosphatase DSP8 n=1 Tax=Cynara cardunculus var. scolymus TaxID=59895 RepID=UPI000D627F78|nr:putative dual specificity protein phosphatase DSP8 [Cynara cardunculus var. scolymus]